MAFSDQLKKLRKNRKMTQQQLANQLGISASTIGMYEQGRRAPDFETLELIADYFNVNIGSLLESDPKPSTGVKVNVYGYVAAGIPIEAIEDIIDVEEISQEMARTGEFFGLRIKGDSMEPRIQDGDVVIVRKQNDAESGDIVIALINGDEGVCKKLVKHTDGISLVSFNPAYEPLYFSNQEVLEKPVAILGRVKELRAKF